MILIQICCLILAIAIQDSFGNLRIPDRPFHYELVYDEPLERLDVPVRVTENDVAAFDSFGNPRRHDRPFHDELIYDEPLERWDVPVGITENDVAAFAAHRHRHARTSPKPAAHRHRHARTSPKPAAHRHRPARPSPKPDSFGNPRRDDRPFRYELVYDEPLERWDVPVRVTENDVAAFAAQRRRPAPTPALPAPKPDACPLFDVAFMAHTVKKIRNVASWEDCAASCQKTAECFVWTYYPGKRCYIKDKKYGARKMARSKAISGPKICGAATQRRRPAPIPGVCPLVDVLLYSQTVKRIGNVVSWQDCAAFCQNTTACFGWTLYTPAKRCYLKDKSPVDSRKRKSSKGISGPKICIAAQRQPAPKPAPPTPKSDSFGNPRRDDWPFHYELVYDEPLERWDVPVGVTENEVDEFGEEKREAKHRRRITVAELKKKKSHG